jgi:hypothetical protein
VGGDRCAVADNYLQRQFFDKIGMAFGLQILLKLEKKQYVFGIFCAPV